LDTPPPECDSLLSLVVSFAVHMLREKGSFYPFGSAISADGKHVSVEADADEDSRDDLLRRLKDSSIKGARAGKYNATALTYLGRLTRHDTGEESRVIVIHLDHRGGLSLVLMIPYTINDKAFALGETTIEDGANDIFVPHLPS
jgi:hypothetical protein